MRMLPHWTVVAICRVEDEIRVGLRCCLCSSSTFIEGSPMHEMSPAEAFLISLAHMGFQVGWVVPAVSLPTSVSPRMSRSCSCIRLRRSSRVSCASVGLSNVCGPRGLSICGMVCWTPFPREEVGRVSSSVALKRMG